jgi:hypothetical protein
MEQREWWYRVHFETPREALDADVRQELVCHGLDTFATIYLHRSAAGRDARARHQRSAA